MEYLKLLKEYENDMKETLAKLVSFESVEANPVRGRDGSIYPFGVGVQEAYEYMLELGRELGFEATDFDNYGGHLEFKDEDSKGIFGITGHIDIMPEGNGWNTPWLTMTEKDGFYYGRGVSDDKGPVIACLYAMKALKEAGIKPKMNVRLIIGLDEETGKKGMEYYLERAGQPDMGITPDGEFPLVNGEMGVIDFDLARRFNKGIADGLRLTKVNGGTAPNVVAGECRAVMVSSNKDDYDRIKDLVNQFRTQTDYTLNFKKQGSSVVVTAVGVPAHGAYPETGVNAISIMMQFLQTLNFANDEVNELVQFYNDYIGFDVNGSKLGCNFCDEASGILKFNVGLIELNEDMAAITINSRVPVSYRNEDIYDAIKVHTEGTGIGIVKGMSNEAIFIDTSHPMVEKLMEAYTEVTGDTENKPMVIPGGTYAKLLNNTLAYGPLFPGEVETIHQANERLSIEAFHKMAEIYARAIYKIACAE